MNLARFMRGGGTGPATDLFQLTPGDGVDIPGGVIRALWVSVDGAIHVTTAAGQERTFPAGFFPTKSFVDLAVTKLWATGTTATVYGAR